MKNFEVLAGDSFSGNDDELSIFDQCLDNTSIVPPGRGTHLECEQAVNGQYVAIRGNDNDRYIHFCTLEVYTVRRKFIFPLTS